MSWTAWNGEDGVCVQSFLILQLDRPGLNPSLATSQLTTSGKSMKWNDNAMAHLSELLGGKQ